MSESHILWKEVLPNALLPLITLLGLSLGSLLVVLRLSKLFSNGRSWPSGY